MSAALALAACASAPTRTAWEPPEHRVMWTFGEDGVSGFLAVHPGEARLCWYSFTPPLGEQLVTAELALPFDRGQAIVQGSGLRFAVAGAERDGGAAWLVLVELDLRTVRIVELARRRYAQFGIEALAWSFDEQRLYALDPTADPRRLLAAPWNGATPLPDESAFEVAATEHDLPDLRAENPAALFTAAAGGVTLHSTPLGVHPPWQRHWHIRHTPNGYALQIREPVWH